MNKNLSNLLNTIDFVPKVVVQRIPGYFKLRQVVGFGTSFENRPFLSAVRNYFQCCLKFHFCFALPSNCSSQYFLSTLQRSNIWCKPYAGLWEPPINHRSVERFECRLHQHPRTIVVSLSTQWTFDWLWLQLTGKFL